MVPGDMPSFSELWPLAVIPFFAGVLKWVRGRCAELEEQAEQACLVDMDKKPGVVFVFPRKHGRRLAVMRFLVVVAGSFGAGFTAGLAVLGAGYGPALQWAAAGFCAVMGWDAFTIARDIIRGRVNIDREN